MNIKLSLLIILIPIILASNNLTDNIINKHFNVDIKSKANEHHEAVVTPSPNPIKASKKEPQYSYTFPKNGIPVLMYHSISYAPRNSLCVSENQFKEEIQWLKSQNYHTITIEEFCNSFLNGALLPVKPVLLTFDDGYLNNYQDAWPILKQNDFKATFFVITNYIGADRVEWSQIKELIAEGNSVGSHSVNHINLASLSEKQQERELYDSKRNLEERLGIKVKAFCFPSGRYNNITLNLLKNIGYSVGFTTSPGRVCLGDYQYTLKRVRISGGMSLATFQSLLK